MENHFKSKLKKSTKIMSISEIDYLLSLLRNRIERMKDKLIFCNLEQDKESYLTEIRLQERIYKKLSYKKNHKENHNKGIY
jgi:hypothetical protein